MSAIHGTSTLFIGLALTGCGSDSPAVTSSLTVERSPSALMYELDGETLAFDWTGSLMEVAYQGKKGTLAFPVSEGDLIASGTDSPPQDDHLVSVLDEAFIGALYEEIRGPAEEPALARDLVEAFAFELGLVAEDPAKRMTLTYVCTGCTVTEGNGYNTTYSCQECSVY